MKIAQVEVSNCYTCPHMTIDWDCCGDTHGTKVICKNMGGKRIVDLNIIPEWCPLPEVVEDAPEKSE